MVEHSTCACVCVCMCLCVCACMHVCVCLRVGVGMHVYVCLRVGDAVRAVVHVAHTLRGVCALGMHARPEQGGARAGMQAYALTVYGVLCSPATKIPPMKELKAILRTSPSISSSLSWRTPSLAASFCSCTSLPTDRSYSTRARASTAGSTCVCV